MTICPATNAHNARIRSSCKTKPCGCSILRSASDQKQLVESSSFKSTSETIASTRNEIQVTAISQVLELLANLRLNILIAGIKTAQVSLECVNIINVEFMFADRFDAFHHFNQPASCF